MEPVVDVNAYDYFISFYRAGYYSTYQAKEKKNGKMKLFISDFIEFVVNKWTELDGYRKASSRNKVKMKIGKLKIKNIKEIQTHQNCLPCRRKVQEVDRVYSEGPRMMMETLVYVSDPWSHLSHPFEYRLHRMPLCRYYLNPRRYFVLAVIANLSAAVK